MEPGDNIREAGKRLARDMRAIRKDRSISAEAVIRATKAAPNVVEEFETTGLVDNPVYNRVYLRLFVRSYADVIGIREEDALSAVDQMLSGRYSDGLARTYLQEAEEPEEAAEEAEPEGEAAGGKKGAPASGGAVAGSDEETDERGETQTGREAEAGSEADSSEDADPAVVAGSISTAASTGPPELNPPVLPQESRGEKSGGPKLLLPDRGTTWRMVGALAGLLVVVLVAWILWPEGEAPEPRQVIPPADSLQSQEPPLPERIVLEDTTTFLLIAARDTLNPVRLTAEAAFLEDRWYDLNSSNTPAWVEYQDTLRVRVVDSLAVTQHADDVDVVVRGVPIPIRLEEGGRRFVLRRSEVQAHLDSLRNARALPTG